MMATRRPSTTIAFSWVRSNCAGAQRTATPWVRR